MRTVFFVLSLTLIFFFHCYGLEVSPGVFFDTWSMIINKDGIRLEHYELRDIYTVNMNDGSSATVIDLGCDGTFDIVILDGRSVFRESPEYASIQEKVFLWIQKDKNKKNVKDWMNWKKENKKGGMKN